MKFDTQCKFCKTPISLMIDDAYAELGDPLNLVKLAACNRCADLKVEKRKLEHFIGEVCDSIRLKMKGFNMEKARAALLESTRQYAHNTAKWCNSPVSLWDEAFAELLIERPDRWGMILGKFRHDCQRSFKETKQAEPVLAYKDQ